MTKLEELTIVKNLVTKYPEIKSSVVTDGQFRKNSNKKILEIISDEVIIPKFCNRLIFLGIPSNSIERDKSCVSKFLKISSSKVPNFFQSN